MGWLIPNVILFASFVIFCNGHSITLFGSNRGVGVRVMKPLVCNEGQAYWCRNISTATSCGALKHCIKAVWEREVPYEKDKSQVCEICLDMVKQARDQLRSNETQEDLIAVLQGSCTMIPIKIVRDDCKKLMEDFAVQIVDVLSSQMDPQVVCSVAGLCYNARVHRLEQEYYSQVADGKTNSKVELNCSNCYSLMNLVRDNLDASSPNNIADFFVELCGYTGSYSDACAVLVTEHINTIQSMLKRNIHASPVCSLAGVCKEKYHNHNKTLVAESLSEGALMKASDLKGDLPCDLCTQLVSHLKDIMIANTTEEEFKMVLMGLCNQMTKYKDQCLTMIDEYYQLVYSFLVDELNGKLLCSQMGLCPKQGDQVQQLPSSDPVVVRVDRIKIEKMQLPVELLNPLIFVPASFMSPKNKVEDKAICAMCEYFLHFVQQEITLPSSEEKIRNLVMKGCDKLPKAISTECDSFVQTYMDAFIALLAQGIDPSQVCPSLGVCPGDLIAIEFKDKPSCPLCLLAMQEITNKVQNNTVSEINDAIDDLCLRDVFPNSLSTECVKFIETFRAAIIDMVVTEFTPQESCVYLDLCVAPDLIRAPDEQREPLPSVGGNIETNEIYDGTDYEDPESSNSCALCEFFMSKLDQMLEDKKTEEEIKEAVLKVCAYMPKTLSVDCKKFVNQYADLVIELLTQELEPKEVCTAINLCSKASTLLKSPMEKCLFCELLMDGLRTVLTDREVDENINHNLEKACYRMPDKEQRYCLLVIEQLAPQVEMALRTLPVGPLVCSRIGMCLRTEEVPSPVLGGANCRSGSAYWCQSTYTAAACNNIEYCQANVWHAEKPRKSHNKGTVVIRY